MQPNRTWRNLVFSDLGLLLCLALGRIALLWSVFEEGQVDLRYAVLDPATGNWSNEIADQEYVERIRNIRNPDYAHPASLAFFREVRAGWKRELRRCGDGCSREVPSCC